jgi:RNA polymerase sigma-70 factor (ECF subfamily)
MKTAAKTLDKAGRSAVSAAAIIAIIPALRAYAISRLRSTDRADDAVQDTLEKAWRARESFEQGSSLKAWMVCIMRNQIIDTFRKNKRIVEDVDGREAARLETPADQLWRLEYADLLSAIDTLTPDMRQALLLVGLGMTHSEGSLLMRIPLGTFKSHVRRGRVRLEEK